MWLDTDDAYWTLDNSYIETVWWLFRQMWDNGDIYEGHKVVPYCGRCGTALSSHELGQPGAYQDVTEPSVYVRFPVVDRDFDLLVWTTTPWTLVSNVGAAVGPDVEYVRVKGAEGRRDLVMGAARVADVLGDDAEVLGPVAVDDLVGLHYERPFDFLELPDVGRARSSPPTSSPSTTARASCTSRPRSARSTARSPTPRASRCSTRSVPRPRSSTRRSAPRRGRACS